jgi:hypothetical protein
MLNVEKRAFVAALLALGGLWLAGCKASHGLLTLRTEETIWGHKLSVTPCAQPSRKTHSDDAPDNSKHTLKCPNAEVVLENEVLSVNGRSYGKLAEKAAVRIEKQKVFINDLETQPLEQTTVAPPASTRTVKQKLAKTLRALRALW